MASGTYNRFKANLFNGLVNLGIDTIRCGLLTDSYTFNTDDNLWGSVASLYEITASGYTAGGMVLPNKTVTQDDINNRAYFDADDITWSPSTITARYIVMYDDTLGSKDLIAAFDFGSNQSSSNGNFTIQWNASGIIILS